MKHLQAVLPGSAVGSSLDDLLASRFRPRRWAERIRIPGDLPPLLQRCVRGLPRNVEWRAYTDGERMFFAIGRLHAEPSPPVFTTALDLFLLDAEGAVYSAGVWDRDPRHGWYMDAVLELSYDSQRGWWVDGLMDAAATTGGDEVAPDVELGLDCSVADKGLPALADPRRRAAPKSRRARLG